MLPVSGIDRRSGGVVWGIELPTAVASQDRTRSSGPVAWIDDHQQFVAVLFLLNVQETLV